MRKFCKSFKEHILLKRRRGVKFLQNVLKKIIKEMAYTNTGINERFLVHQIYSVWQHRGNRHCQDHYDLFSIPKQNDLFQFGRASAQFQ